MVQKDKIPFVKGKNIGEAYINTLDLLINRKLSYPFLILHIAQPTLVDSIGRLPTSYNVDDWGKILNLGVIFEVFSKYDFSKTCGRGGSLGKDWINDRNWELLHPEGGYYKRLARFRQLERVVERLNVRDKRGKRMHGGSTNALICQVFHPDRDLIDACKPRPRARGLACLTELDFKPKGKKLHLFSIFRSQYFDTKAYGNLISLSMLLCKICKKTDYKPGTLTSTANNITFDVLKNKKDQRKFYGQLSTI